jgi:hypothetical protein
VTAERLDIAAECGHLEWLAIGDDRHGTVVDAGRHGLEPGLPGKGDHPLRVRRCGKVDFGDRKPKQRIAHGTTNGARLDAVAIQRRKHGTRFRQLKPLGAGKRRSHRSAVKILRDHFEFVAA